MNRPLSQTPLPEARDVEVTENFCLANARLVLEDRVVTGQIIVEGGMIAGLEETADVPFGAIDCAGDLLIPGLVELHTDNLERHIEPRPSVEWPHDAAIIAHDGELASTGITTVFDAMRVGSSTDGRDYKAYARNLSSELLALRDAGALRISHHIHLRAEICSETLLEELDTFGPEDRVGLVSLMDHTPGQRQFRDLEKLKAYHIGKRGGSEAKFAELVAARKALQERIGAKHEAGAVAAANRLGAVLASHDDTTAEQVAVSARHGIRLAEFPTTVEAAQACRDAGIAIMMGAPNIIRGGSHSGNVSAPELARMDLLDIVSSDYVPAALLSSSFRLATLWDDLPRAIRCVTANPARAVGLTDRGVLAKGQRADIARVHRFGDTPVLRSVWCAGRRVG
ncbi:alpha-D-ribose 1-methylphosphonate 5-triphosphate diphosphatase [Yoonia sp. 2307UL14-13]|uniref:alpha-D-ribose 1-methylphosphonate 5-triphosphate diphosphatase n=1 Tax=Yoonia sp. 2307UL14-13 TaxID=3126506 RepID=UPI00309D7860